MKRKRKGNFITLKEVVDDFTKNEAAQNKFDELNNEIKWREPNEKRHDGSELHFLRQDGFGLFEY